MTFNLEPVTTWRQEQTRNKGTEAIQGLQSQTIPDLVVSERYSLGMVAFIEVCGLSYFDLRQHSSSCKFPSEMKPPSAVKVGLSSVTLQPPNALPISLTYYYKKTCPS